MKKQNNEPFSLFKYNFTAQYLVYSLFFAWLGWLFRPSILMYFSFFIAIVCFILEFISPYAMGRRMITGK